MELAFAALHQLCAPMLDRLDRLPGPQRDALADHVRAERRARCRTGSSSAWRCLSLLSEAAEERPLLCVVDDAQWLDRASAQALAFVARRLLAESVVMLFAAREPSDLLAGLPELVVEGFGDADARALLASVIPGRLDERVADQLVAETRGNPLALLELPRGLSPAQLAGGFGLPARAVAVGPDRGELPEAARGAARGHPAAVVGGGGGADRRSGACCGARPSDWGSPARRSSPAESAGLIEVDSRVRFRHPLVRSAVYRAATPSRARGAHRALAEATDAQARSRPARLAPRRGGGRPRRGRRRRARAGGRPRPGAGGLAAAAAFLERAAALTPEPSSAARSARWRRRRPSTRRARSTTLSLSWPPPRRAPSATSSAPGSHLLRAQIAFASRRGSDAPPLLLKAARELEAVDPSLARATYLEALSAAMFAGRLARGGGRREVSEAALAGPPPPHRRVRPISSSRAWRSGSPRGTRRERRS